MDMLQCYNRGCGKTFDPNDNKEDACCYHPGEPFFHDAYKGWSCCKRKSVDFTEFLNMKGCTFSKHSNVKPPEPKKPLKSVEETPVEVRAPIREALPRPPITRPLIRILPKVAEALKESIDSITSQKRPKKESKLSANEIPVGTSCKNMGCSYTYTDTVSDSSECQYHPGVPIFHEGMKYWSCCQKKTTDFTAFMNQKGCAYGQHKWFKVNGDSTDVQCRYDWHQTGTNVIVSIYAKKYHYEKSTIEVNPIRLKVCLEFPEQDNAQFNLDLELRGIIDPANTSAQMFASKLEITMRKVEPGSWSKLDFPKSEIFPTKPTVNEAHKPEKSNADSSDDDFDLDDIETLKPNVRLADVS